MALPDGQAQGSGENQVHAEADFSSASGRTDDVPHTIGLYVIEHRLEPCTQGLGLPVVDVRYESVDAGSMEGYRHGGLLRGLGCGTWRTGHSLSPARDGAGWLPW